MESGVPGSVTKVVSAHQQAGLRATLSSLTPPWAAPRGWRAGGAARCPGDTQRHSSLTPPRAGPPRAGSSTGRRGKGPQDVQGTHSDRAASPRHGQLRGDGHGEGPQGVQGTHSDAAASARHGQGRPARAAPRLRTTTQPPGDPQATEL